MKDGFVVMQEYSEACQVLTQALETWAKLAERSPAKLFFHPRAYKACAI